MNIDENISIIFSELAIDAYHTAKESGFYDNGIQFFGEKIALMHSELSEALEAFRETNNYETWYEKKVKEPGHITIVKTDQFLNGVNMNKPCGVPSELADTIIRILDFCGANNIDIGKAIQEKMAFNKTREHKHGKHF